ncbi:MAG: hypothetical protein LC808_24620 [Actinobacteria bacterium]|nr:hypothetical protein [Actinomycetota bacterium]
MDGEEALGTRWEASHADRDLDRVSHWRPDRQRGPTLAWTVCNHLRTKGASTLSHGKFASISRPTTASRPKQRDRVIDVVAKTGNEGRQRGGVMADRFGVSPESAKSA